MRYHVLLTHLIPGKAYEIEEDPDVSASLPFFFRPFRIHIGLASPSGKLMTSGGHLSPALVPT